MACGFILCDVDEENYFLNMILSVIMYAIFKCNSKAKFDNARYRNIDIIMSVKTQLVYYKQILRGMNTLHINRVMFNGV